ncbi:DUF6233 domain-containing protein [Streptomyces sp. NPDC004682]
MAELPPDAPRLQVILAHLDRQIAENSTVDTYLRLQRAAVQKALARSEPPPRQQRPTRLAKGASGPLPAFTRMARTAAYAVEQKRSTDDPNPAVVHLAHCKVITGSSRTAEADDARAALMDPNFEPCPECRPESELGIDLA